MWSASARGSDDRRLRTPVAVARGGESRFSHRWIAWFHLGEAQQGERAIAAYRRTLEIDPTFTRAYLALSRALIARGDRDEALRYLRHGIKAAAKPEQIREAMKGVEGMEAPSRDNR